MSLATKTVALLTAIVTMVFAVASVASLHAHEQSLKESAFKGLDGQAQTAARGVATFVEGSLREAQAVALALPGEAADPRRRPEIEAHLERMYRAFPNFQNGIFLLDARGTFVTDYPRHPELRGESLAFREYYQRAVSEKRPIVGQPYRSKRTGKPVLTFAAPVLGAQGEVTAIVACSVDLVSREALGGYRHLKFGTTGYLYVFDRERRLVLHPQDDRLLAPVTAGKNRILEAALAGYEGSGETLNSQGVPMLLAVRRVPGTEWIVGAQVPADEAYRPILEARSRSAAASIGALLLIMVAAALALRHVSRPLQHLERAASRIAARLGAAPALGAHPVSDGALDALRRVRSSDEIGLLASAFVRLADELQRTVDSLQRSAEDWERTFNTVQEAVFTLDPAGRIVRMNSTAERWFESSAREACGRAPHAVVLGAVARPDGWPDLSALAPGPRLRWSRTLDRPRGVFEFIVTPMAAGPVAAGAVLVVSDVTERMRAEADLLRAQKLESVGVLAGGIAHDFNNILTAILGNVEAAKDAVSGETREMLDDAEKAALRAKDLTRQLLTFARGGAPIKKVTSLAEAIRDSAHFALRGASARGELSIAEDLWAASVDEGQISQVIHNVVLNAVQAMPQGGVVAIDAANLEVVRAGDLALAPGKYLRITIADDGVGLSPEHLARIFDPYFTTKPTGSGLGLTSSYAIVKKHDGHIQVESELGRGTTFRIYLPASEQGAPQRREVEGAQPSPGGRVLLMDDEEAVRVAGVRMLKRLGYDVEVAATGEEALRLYAAAREASRPFDAVIMDLTVPGAMGGKEAMRRLRAADPDAKGIVSSGYSTDPVMADFQAHGFCAVVSKPYALEELSAALREAIGRARS